jgi:hypothetical protein
MQVLAQQRLLDFAQANVVERPASAHALRRTASVKRRVSSAANDDTTGIDISAPPPCRMRSASVIGERNE